MDDSKLSPARLFEFRNTLPCTPLDTNPSMALRGEVTQDMVQDIVTELTKPLTIRITELEVENVNKCSENKELKARLIKLEGHMRRGNLKFYGFDENSYESKFDCKKMVLQVLEQSNISLHPKGIESAHRIGPKQARSARPIIAKFFHAEERIHIL